MKKVLVLLAVVLSASSIYAQIDEQGIYKSDNVSLHVSQVDYKLDISTGRYNPDFSTEEVSEENFIEDANLRLDLDIGCSSRYTVYLKDEVVGKFVVNDLKGSLFTGNQMMYYIGEGLSGKLEGFMVTLAVRYVDNGGIRFILIATDPYKINGIPKSAELVQISFTSYQ